MENTLSLLKKSDKLKTLQLKLFFLLIAAGGITLMFGVRILSDVTGPFLPNAWLNALLGSVLICIGFLTVALGPELLRRIVKAAAEN
ncbi:hypothetical protein KC865_02535 [Candidatus Kaiserbacteria bacterium]|nr:hypothetical protein [Candidatus Kaiserbacteria bacterium]